MKKHTESPERLGFLSGSRKNDRRRRRFVYILVAANPLNSSWHSTQQAHQINAGECVRIDSVRADASLLYNLGPLAARCNPGTEDGENTALGASVRQIWPRSYHHPSAVTW